MHLADAVVLITGANRGIGRAFAREALQRGARRVYAAARDPASVDLPGVLPIPLDVTDPAQVTALHMGFVDTDLTRGIDMPKSSPESIVRAAFDGLEAGAEEVLADDATRQVKLSLSTTTPAYLGQA